MKNILFPVRLFVPGLFVASLLLLVSCGNSKEAVKTEPSAGETELALPVVPESLRDVESRASFVVEHFWDAMDFADTVRSHNAGFMEQNFVNFLSVFPMASDKVRSKATERLMKAAAPDTLAFNLLCRLAEQYLFDAESPMHSDAHYLPFGQQQLLRARGLSLVERERVKSQVAVAGKNLPGSQAPDFQFLTPDGQHHTLRQFCQRCTTLLLFYDPDCRHCGTVIQAMSQSDELNEKISQGRLQILAVCVESTPEVWRATHSVLPSVWTVALDETDVQSRDLYILRSFPTLMLLSPDGKILAKEPRWEDL